MDSLLTTMSPKEKGSLFLSNHQLIRALLPRVGPWGPLLHLYWIFDWLHLVKVTSLCGCVQQPCLAQKPAFYMSPPPVPTSILSACFSPVLPSASPVLPSAGWERLMQMAHLWLLIRKSLIRCESPITAAQYRNEASVTEIESNTIHRHLEGILTA